MSSTPWGAPGSHLHALWPGSLGGFCGGDSFTDGALICENSRCMKYTSDFDSDVVDLGLSAEGLGFVNEPAGECCG